MKQLIKYLKQLQETAERDHENSELIHYRMLEAERQKWDAQNVKKFGARTAKKH